MHLSQGSSSTNSGSPASKSLKLAMVEALTEEPASKSPSSSPPCFFRRSALSANNWATSAPGCRRMYSVGTYSADLRHKASPLDSGPQQEADGNTWHIGRNVMMLSAGQRIIHVQSTRSQQTRRHVHLLLGCFCFWARWLLPSPLPSMATLSPVTEASRAPPTLTRKAISTRIGIRGR